MDLIVADDPEQKKPGRRGMGPLVAVGGLHVPGDHIGALERGLTELCEQTGFPPDEEFKWSPGSELWMRDNLKGADRATFFRAALKLARDARARAIVVIEDTRSEPAHGKDHEESVVTMLLERAHNTTISDAMLLFDRPSGDREAENRFLSSRVDTLREGTTFVTLSRIVIVAATQSRFCRILQLADVVTSCTLAYVAGESAYAPETCAHITPLLRREVGRVGGVGIKIHPDYRYANLYHWLFGDSLSVRSGQGWPLPTPCRAYSASPDRP